MGDFVIKPFTKILAWLIAALLIYLNSKMVSGNYYRVLAATSTLGTKILYNNWMCYIRCCCYWSYLPRGYKGNTKNIQVHPHAHPLENLDSPTFKKIAVALDFLRMTKNY